MGEISKSGVRYKNKAIHYKFKRKRTILRKNHYLCGKSQAHADSTTNYRHRTNTKKTPMRAASICKKHTKLA